MENLNEIQQLLEVKCKMEIREAVMSFNKTLVELSNKYDSSNWYYIHREDPWNKTREEVISFSSEKNLIKEIEEMLISKHLPAMVKAKSKQLIDRRTIEEIIEKL